MSEHMLQSARLAEESGASDELIAAALLHDIGHSTNEFPEDALERGVDNHHDAAGARVLEPFFPPLVIACVRHHVRAKRYLYVPRTPPTSGDCRALRSIRWPSRADPWTSRKSRSPRPNDE